MSFISKIDFQKKNTFVMFLKKLLILILFREQLEPFYKNIIELFRIISFFLGQFFFNN